ncbi:hypothetical protein BCR34DRAFT_595184 [Clohesyomyces aquaticus]|uniref:Uncharacterized protein n=1 Tax=Clohesyomyces aquaticus TaxID=1231657 RepID=A0A1Y2AAZ2_9PLEO|nr:hypothetical protein BCR34DRAFT_595184 [Clohesyomyces aquaticus]
MNSVDHNLEQTPKGMHHRTELPKPSPLGPLVRLQGKWVGTGFNQISRPRNKTSNTKFSKPLNLEDLINDNLMELKLTSEQLTFLELLGEADIFLNGIPYTQTVKDVTNTDTGRGNLAETPGTIHFETGMMMFIPGSKIPTPPDQLLRMANIPHGTFISARGPASPTITKSKAPDIPKSTARLPQDLDNFIAAGTIDQAVLSDSNKLLRKQNKKTKFIETTSFFFDSSVPIRRNDILDGDENTDIMNIPFLRGNSRNVNNPNANTVRVGSKFCISTVEHTVTAPAWKPTQADHSLRIPAHTGANVPLLEVTSSMGIAAPKQITVWSMQIQYSQSVLLQFASLNWPHVNVATLVPASPTQVAL